MEKPDEGQYIVPVKWVDLEDTPIDFTNQMLIQHVENEFVLTFGYFTPPAFLKPPTEEELEGVGEVPIKPIVRLGMTADRLIELIRVLQTNYRKYQEKLAGRQGYEIQGDET